MPLNILLADDHQIVRQGLKALLEEEGFKVVCEASNGQEAIAMARLHEPDVAVLDLSMPVLNGIVAAEEIRKSSGNRIRVVLLTVHSERQYVLQAMRAGIRGYVLKTRAAADLIQAITDVSNGLTYLSSGVSQAVVEAYLTKEELASQESLTPRELQVLQLVAEGKTTKEVASLLGVSFKTAESHRTRIMEKLDIHETAGLVRYAIRKGIIQA
ncbi:MAG: response regulator transcription factor [Acidobacteria bacterium]|nr:response regulator transcription factor [Acidobacteriota bacterium]